MGWKLALSLNSCHSLTQFRPPSAPRVNAPVYWRLATDRHGL
jgi:hypothetical protein